jgi:hypothetical protein
LKEAPEIRCSDDQSAHFVWNCVSENRVICGNSTRNTLEPERSKKWLAV